MEKIDGVSSAFVNNGIQLYLAEDAKLPEGAVKEVLSQYKMGLKDMSKMEALPF